MTENINQATRHARLVMAVTEYDRKQAKRKGYNRYALPQYLAAIRDAEQQRKRNEPIREALVYHFSGRLLDALLASIGEPKATLQEHRSCNSSAPRSSGRFKVSDSLGRP